VIEAIERGNDVPFGGEDPPESGLVERLMLTVLALAPLAITVGASAVLDFIVDEIGERDLKFI
jgi:hypothetical protein